MKQIALLLLACTISFLSCKKTATSMISLPSVSTLSIIAVRETSAISGGDVINTGNSVLTARGVCWSASHNPTVADDTTLDGTGIGGFVSSITHLIANTTYYVRAYASNSAGTAYGKEDTFTTQPSLPEVSTTNITAVSYTSVISGGDVVTAGSLSVIARGVCWSSSHDPTVADDTTRDGSGTGSYVSSITHLIANTTYYVRAYASSSVGTGYGKVDTFTTQSSLPAVSTANITSVTATSAISGGDVVSTGNSAVNARGVCWGTSHNPTVADDTTMDGTGIGSFVSSITHLIANTTYFVRAYASNSAGTAYGKEDTFTTTSLPPPPFSATYYGSYIIGANAPRNITIQITNGAPSGFIDGNTYPINGAYAITAGLFSPPHLVVTSTHHEQIVFSPFPYVQSIRETVWTTVSLDGQMVDSTWSGTIYFMQRITSSSQVYNRVTSYSGSFICHGR